MKPYSFTVMLALAVAATSGCVTKKHFRQTIADQDQKISQVQSGVEENERRIGDLKQGTDQEVARLEAQTGEVRQSAASAMTRAEGAEKLARGKVLWEVTLTNDQVKFASSEAKLPETAITPLDELATQVKALDKTVYLEIEGHTDGAGSEEYNYELGLRRAEAVRKYLSNGDDGAGPGLPLHMMNVISYGETKAIADNSTREGRAQNRRVVIRVLE